MKQSWELKKLGDIILENKKSILKSKGNAEGVYPFFISGMKVKTCNKSIIDGQNIFLPTGGNFYVHFYNGESSYSTDTWSIKTDKNTDIKYFYFFLLLNRDFINEKHFKGATIKHLQKNDFKALEIPLPPLPEQQRIVAILDEAFAAIAKAKANAEQNLKNAKGLFEVYLNNVFESDGWEEKRLEELLEEQPKNGWSPPAKNHSDFGVPVLTLSAVTGFDFKSNCVKYTNAKVNLDAFYWVNNGDLLITRSNTAELVGHVAICKDLSSRTIYPDLIMKINPKKLIISTQFLYHQLKSKKLRSIIMDAAHGANPTMKKINKQDVQNFKIRYPSLKVQEAIVLKLDVLLLETKKLEAIYQQKISDLEELKNSILQKAFAGELKTEKELAI